MLPVPCPAATLRITVGRKLFVPGPFNLGWLAYPSGERALPLAQRARHPVQLPSCSHVHVRLICHWLLTRTGGSIWARLQLCMLIHVCTYAMAMHV